MPSHYADAKKKAWDEAAASDKAALDKGELPTFAAVDAPRDQREAGLASWLDRPRPAEEQYTQAGVNLEDKYKLRLLSAEIKQLLALADQEVLTLSDDFRRDLEGTLKLRGKSLAEDDAGYAAYAELKRIGPSDQPPGEPDYLRPHKDLKDDIMVEDEERSRAARTAKGGGQAPTLD